MTRKISPEAKQLLIDSANPNIAESAEARTKLADILTASVNGVTGDEETSVALDLPLRPGILPGDIHSGIFTSVEADGNSSLEYPLHYIAPGTEDDYVAFTLPTYGSVPKKHIEGDFVNIPIIDIGGSIDWDNKYARNARWDIVSDALNTLRMEMVKKKNDMAWHTLLSAAVDRGAVVADSDAAQGQFTTRLVSLAKTAMRRNGGGNSTSVNRSRLTDLYVSVEALEDMRSWNVDVVDEITRREIFTSTDGVLNRIFNVNIHDIDELGEGQEYQDFVENTLGVTLPTTGGHQDVEVCLGLDQSANNAFISPMGESLQILPDNTRVRHRETAYIALESLGFAVVDARKLILMSF